MQRRRESRHSVQASRPAPLIEIMMPYQDPPLPTEDDLAAFQQPGDGMLTSPAVQQKAPTGVGFDWSILNVQTQDEYEAKPPEIQHLIHEIKQLGVLPSQEWAANRVVEIQKEIATRNSPEALARAEKAKLDLQSAEAEARTKANETAAGRARITGVLDTIAKLEPNIDNLVGPLAPAAQMKDKWINPDIYAQRFDLANTTKNDVLEAAKYVKPLSNDERKFLEDMFPKIDDPAPVWRNYFERTRRMLGAGLGDSAPVNPQVNAPQNQPAPPAAERMIRGQRWILNPQTGKYYVAPGQ